MIPGESWWSGNGHEWVELFKTIVAQLRFKVGVSYPQSNRNAILPLLRSHSSIRSHSWPSLGNRELAYVAFHEDPARIFQDDLGNSRVGLRVARM